ncbi:MAG TPA: phosphopantothenoylcysteine decarboxylase [Chthoniobacterales bacterium]
MRVIVTCGPSFEPIDEVRRITNFSTGELGVLLADHLADTGFEVLCLRGVAATYPVDPTEATVIPFSTNDDLEAQLGALSKEGGIAAVFHAAALCDYRVCGVTDHAGQSAEFGKIPSRKGSLTLTLEPTTKLISKMRAWFPASRIVGWKYELEGTIESGFAKVSRQIADNRLDGCVANGRAFGRGYGFCQKYRRVRHLPSKRLLCRFLAGWLLNETMKESSKTTDYALV